MAHDSRVLTRTPSTALSNLTRVISADRLCKVDTNGSILDSEIRYSRPTSVHICDAKPGIETWWISRHCPGADGRHVGPITDERQVILRHGDVRVREERSVSPQIKAFNHLLVSPGMDANRITSRRCIHGILDHQNLQCVPATCRAEEAGNADPRSTDNTIRRFMRISLMPGSAQLHTPRLIPSSTSPMSNAGSAPHRLPRIERSTSHSKPAGRYRTRRARSRYSDPTRASPIRTSQAVLP